MRACRLRHFARQQGVHVVMIIGAYDPFLQHILLRKKKNYSRKEHRETIVTFMVSKYNVFCAHCGNWLDEHAPPGTRYCSTACREAAYAEIHRLLELSLVQLLADGKTDCVIGPADAAAALVGTDWRRYEDAARKAARRLAHDGVVMCVQGSDWVDPTSVTGRFVVMRGPFWHENGQKIKISLSD